MVSCARFPLIALAIVGTASALLAPTDALAAKKKGKVVAQAAVVPAPVVVPDSNIPADRVPRCFDSVIRYRVPPCY
jgi:hypothetical protein